MRIREARRRSRNNTGVGMNYPRNRNRCVRPVLCALAGAALALLPGCGVETGGGEGIITFGPHITEVVFALDEGGRVIAVDDYSDYPPPVQALPKVGANINPALEKITLLEPEMILAAGANEKMAAHARLNKIPVFNIHMDSFETIGAGIERIGELLGCPRAARALHAEFDADIAGVDEALSEIEPLKTLIITGRTTHDLNTLHTVGGASFVSEVVELAGGRNIFRDTKRPYFEASKETVVARAPEVIVEFHCGEGLTEKQRAAYRRDWEALPTLPAVRGKRIHFVTASHGLRPGPRIVEIARALAFKLHPRARMLL